MKSLVVFLVLLPFRLMLPFAFLIGLVLNPIESLRSLPYWPRAFKALWDEPI